MNTKYNYEITINSNSNKILLNDLKQENKSLYEHLIAYSIFIGLIHDLRNIIIHNEMLENGSFHITPYVVTKGIKLPRKLFEKLKQCPHDMNKTKRQEFWGVLKIDEKKNVYVDLFKFAKTCCIEVFEFTNTYMEFIGCDNYIMVLKKTEQSFFQILELFEENYFDLCFEKNKLRTNIYI